MGILEQLNDELKHSVLNRNKEKSTFLRTVKGEFDRTKDITEDLKISILKEMLDNATQLSNDFEMEILEKLLPTMLTIDEIEEEIINIIEENNFTSMKDLKPLMKNMKEKHGPLYDGKIASSFGKDKLGFDAIKRD
jgi:uncharacterized protein YqeY